MTNISQGIRPWEFIAREHSREGARGQIVLAAGQVLGAGTVLGKVTATGKHVILAPGASDGSQTPAAFLGSATDASAGDRRTAALVPVAGQPVELFAAFITWPAGITAPQKSQALTTLAGLGVKFR